MKKNVKLSKNGLIALVALGGLLIVGAGWMLLLAPKQKEIASLRQQTAAARQQIADDLSRAAVARNATGAPTIKVADIYKLTTAMPSITDMPDLLLELDQAAKAAGVTLQSIAPGPITASSTGVGYSTIPITVAAGGNFYTITDLLYRLRNFVYVRSGALEANGRIFSVSNVSLTPNGRAVTAQITLDTYVYGTATPATPGLPTQTTGTSTTGTSTTTTTAATPPPASSSGPSAAGATP